MYTSLRLITLRLLKILCQANNELKREIFDPKMLHLKHVDVSYNSKVTILAPVRSLRSDLFYTSAKSCILITINSNKLCWSRGISKSHTSNPVYTALSLLGAVNYHCVWALNILFIIYDSRFILIGLLIRTFNYTYPTKLSGWILSKIGGTLF